MMRPTREARRRPAAAPGRLSSPLAVLLLALSCSAPPVGKDPMPAAGPPPAIAPEWAIHGISDAHPDTRWLQAVGSAAIESSVEEARERAELDARGKLVRNLSSTVRAVTESHDLFQANDTESRLAVSLDQTVHVVGEGTLEGARPIEFYVDRDANLAHCLLVLERAPAAHEMARRVEVAEADAAALLARAKQAGPAQALAALATAYDHILAARVLRVSYAVLAHGPLAMHDSVGDQVIARLRALSSELTLRVVAGDGQHGRVGAALPEPIVFELHGQDGSGIDGVDLGFHLRGAAQAELAPPRRATTEGGKASVVLRALGTSGARSNQVEARVEALASRALPGPTAIAEFLLPTPADTRVLAGTTATAHGEATDPSDLQAGVIAALAAAGFGVVPASAVAAQLGEDEVMALSVPELCRRLRGEVDYVVRVLGTAQEASSRQDRMRARASAVVLVIDVATGRVDQFLSDPADGLGDTHAQAAELSLSRLGDVLGATVVARVRARAGV